MPLTKYTVVGMDCASCANIIKRKISKLDGVESIDVNLATEKAELKTKMDIPLSTLNEVISPLGYELQNENPSIGMPGHDMSKMDHSLHAGHDMTPIGGSDNKQAKLAQLDNLKNHVNISLPLATISILMMIWETFFPYPDYVKTFFHHLLPVMATYTLFVIGLPYLKSVIKFFQYRVANMDTLIGIGTSVAFLYSFIISAFEGILAPYLAVDQVYYDVTIVVIAFITLGKTALNISILHLLRQPWTMSFLSGVVLGQLGEFSFLLASVGEEVGIVTQYGTNLIVSLTVLSLALSPIWLATAKRLHDIAPKRATSFMKLLNLLFGREFLFFQRIYKKCKQGLSRRANLPD